MFSIFSGNFVNEQKKLRGKYFGEKLEQKKNAGNENIRLLVVRKSCKAVKWKDGNSIWKREKLKAMTLNFLSLSDDVSKLFTNESIATGQFMFDKLIKMLLCVDTSKHDSL